MSGTAVTVLMATHNGAQTLPRVLEAYSQLTCPAGGFQVVVADNASNDTTSQILSGFLTRLPLQVVHVPERGKNRALNTALPLIRGELVVLTDDDTPPDSAWLKEYAKASQNAHEFSLFGGPIKPIWPVSGCPDWIARLVNLGATFGLTPQGIPEGEVSSTQVWGGNMAVRRTVFDAGFRFNPDVGPAAGQYTMGSEVEFSGRLAQAGHRAYWVPGAAVGHIIREQQLERDWIIQRAFRLGRHMFHQERGQIPPETVMWRGAPRWRYGQLVRQKLRSLWGKACRDFDASFLADWELSFLRGYLSEAARVQGDPS